MGCTNLDGEWLSSPPPPPPKEIDEPPPGGRSTLEEGLSTSYAPYGTFLFAMEPAPP